MADSGALIAKLEAAEAAFHDGEFTKASLLSGEVLSEQPENIRALMVAGVAAMRRNVPGPAIQFLKKVVKQDSTQWDALNWLCVLLRQQGETNQAIICGKRACELRPDSAIGQTNLGSCHLARWQFKEALACFEIAASLDPNLPTARHNLGVALERLGRAEDAIAEYRKAAQLDPSAPNPLVSLGSLLRKRGGSDEADQAFSEAAKRVTGSLIGLQALAKALTEEGNLKEAESTLVQANELAPGTPNLLVPLGHVRQQLGRFSEAIECFQKALEANPHDAEALFELAQCRRMTTDDSPLIQRMESCVQGPDLSPSELRHLHYALGKAYDDTGAFEKAFRHFREANAQIYREFEGMRVDRQALIGAYDQIMATFTPEFFAANRSVADPSELPILVVGMIRSGTTLIEQILSSHPDVGAGGELQFLLENGAVLHPTQGLLVERAKSVGENYLRLLASIAPGKSRVTDKMPNNTVMLGLVHLLFPNARIVHCRRNPTDTCLSIYTTPFRSGLNFAHDPDEIAFNYEQYLRLMHHWRTVLPRRNFLEVQYESLIDDREAVVRRLVEFCGLTWNDSCMEHQRRGGAVVTPSNWQVRQPIYRTSIGRWEQYRQWLPQFERLDALAGP